MLYLLASFLPQAVEQRTLILSWINAVVWNTRWNALDSVCRASNNSRQTWSTYSIDFPRFVHSGRRGPQGKWEDLYPQWAQIIHVDRMSFDLSELLYYTFRTLPSTWKYRYCRPRCVVPAKSRTLGCGHSTCPGLFAFVFLFFLAAFDRPPPFPFKEAYLLLATHLL